MDRWKAEMGRVREKRRVEERRSEKRKSQKKEDADARKGRKVAKHCVFPMIWEMKNCTPLWREAHFEVKMYKTHHSRTTFGSWDVEKVHAVVARSTFPKSKCTKHTMYGPLLDVQISFRVAGARDCAPCQKWTKREGFVAFPKTMAGVGHLKRICKDAFSVAGAVQETSGITFSWQAQCFRHVDWKNRKTHWYEAVSFALNFPFLKDVSQNCFVFDVVKFKNSRRLSELPRFGCCPVQKNEEVSQNCFVFDVVNFEKWGCLAGELRFQACRKTDRQTDRDR